jgi:septum site-determining protein MinD
MLAVAGGKGGCGKTTTTLGLAAALVRQRKSAVAADADREMPNLHAMAGVRREPGLDAVAEGWPARIVAGTADPPALGVEVVPAASGPPNASGRKSVENCALVRLRGSADAVLLDCPAGAGPDAAAPLRIADAAVIVTTAEPACLRDAAKTAAMARELGATVAGAVVSRVTEPSRTAEVSRETGVPEGIARLLDCPVLGVVPDAGAEGEGGTRGGGDRGTRGSGDSAGACTDPLADDRVRAAYDHLLSALQPKYL